MSDTGARTVEQLASDLGVTVQEVVEAAKHFTTTPGALLEGAVPPKVASRVEAYFATEK